MKIIYNSVLFFLLLYVSPVYSNDDVLKKDSQSSLEIAVDDIVKPFITANSPGLAIGVVRDGELIFSKGYGLANLEYDIPITPSTIFHMASVSKQFTAFAAVLLAQQGKISLDDDIRKYIPEIPDFGKTITIKNLIHHTSGLRDQWELLIMAGWRMDDVITKDDILRLVKRQKELNFNPGDEHLYCNTGYTLIAEIVSRVTGKTFNEWTKENIFESLGMENSFFYDDHEKLVKNRAYSYHPADNGFKKSVLSYANAGATSLFTNINDLVKWVNNFETPVVGDKQALEQMEERGVLNNGDTIDYAFGQVLTKYNNSKMIIHDGGDAGYRTTLARFPDQKCAVIVLSNLATLNMHGIALQVADLLLKDEPFKQVLEEEKKETEEVQVEESLLKEYEGSYELQPGLVITITHEDNGLMIQATGQAKFPLFAKSNTKFFLKVVDAQVNFVRNDNNAVDKLILHQNGANIPCRRIEQIKEEPVQLDDYAGTYYSDELEATYFISVKDNQLTVQNVHMNDIVLIPAGKDKFNYSGFINLVFARNSDNRIDSFRVSTGRVRNLLFEKR